MEKTKNEENIITLYKNGASFGKLSKQLKIGEHIIAKCLKDNNVLIRNRSESAKLKFKNGYQHPNLKYLVDIFKLKKEYDLGNSLGEIVKKYDIPKNVVYRKLKQANTCFRTSNQSWVLSLKKGRTAWNKNKKNVQKAWNKGLTKETDERVKKYSKTKKGKIFSKERYPRFGWRTSRKNQIIPKKDTTIELKIQNYLKQLQISFFTHQYMDIEHGYQCDIFIPSFNLVIECDGDYWHKYPVGRDIDKIRTSELISSGFKILRLWEHDIKIMDLNEFKDKLNV